MSFFFVRQNAMRTSMKTNEKKAYTHGEKERSNCAAITEFDVIQRVRKTAKATVTITQIRELRYLTYRFDAYIMCRKRINKEEHDYSEELFWPTPIPQQQNHHQQQK